jgi:hypothetical protein
MAANLFVEELRSWLHRVGEASKLFALIRLDVSCTTLGGAL